MPDSLVTTTELAIHNDWPDGTYPADRAQQAVWAATAMIQAETGQRVIAVAGDVVVGYATTDTFWLPERPVTAVTQIAVTGGPIYTSSANWTLVADKLTLGAWLRWPAELTITYSHGYATVPEQLKWVCCSAAARLLDNPGSLRSATVGGESAVWAGTGFDVGPGLAEAERAALAPWREVLVH